MSYGSSDELFRWKYERTLALVSGLYTIFMIVVVVLVILSVVLGYFIPTIVASVTYAIVSFALGTICLLYYETWLGWEFRRECRENGLDPQG